MNNIDILFHGILLKLTNSNDIYTLLSSYPKLIRYTQRYKLKYKIINALTIKDIINGSHAWRYNGRLHRENDQPAIIYKNGYQAWYYNGKRHRENDQPAVIYATGSKEWWYNGLRHRENDQPAAIYVDGTKEWWYNGKLHRENGEPAIINAYGDTEWWYNGLRHRENGGQIAPWAIFRGEFGQENLGSAQISAGNRLCRFTLPNSSLPAIIWADGTQEWWFNGKKLK